jgi:phosphoglucosamine mutase
MSKTRRAASPKESLPPAVRKLFGTDGIRGLANSEPMTPELALRLGRAIAWVAGGEGSSAPRVVIGKDTRLSGYMLETALASGICAMGGTVLLSGPIPTPAVANLTHSMRADAGGRDQRQPQSLSGQWHQAVRSGRLQAAGSTGGGD